jgi:hypothetical protein
MWDFTAGLLVSTIFGIPVIFLMYKIVSDNLQAYNEGKKGA